MPTLVMLAVWGIVCPASGRATPAVFRHPPELREDHVIVKIRPGFLTPGGTGKGPRVDPAAEVQQWALQSGSASAKALWAAPTAPMIAVSRDDHPGYRSFVLTPAAGVTPQELVDRLERLPWVECAEIDRLLDLHTVPNDPLFPRQWHLNNTGQPYWAIVGIPGTSNDTVASLNGIPGADVRFLGAYNHPGPKARVPVCIIDTGLDIDHEDLQGRLFTNTGEIPGNGVDDDHNGFVDDLFGWDFSGNAPATPNTIVQDNDVRDSIGHGTHVGGTVAAAVNNNVGIAGVCDSALLFAAKIFPNAYFSVSAQAIYYAVLRGARVINMSWGGAYPSNALRDALRYAHERGVVLVTSMGNSGQDEVFYPSGYPETIGVGASTSLDRLGTFSTYNNLVDVVAPGRDVLSLRAAGSDMYAGGGEPDVHIIGERYYIASGTSMAAPHVSGAAAVLLSLAPGLTNSRVREILRGTADDVTDPYGDGAHLPGFDRFTGWGRINLERAIAELPGVFAAITAPEHLAWLGGNVPIFGFASGTSFADYTMLAAPGHQPSATDFVVISTGNSPVNGGILANWDTDGLEGPWTLRLDAGPDAVYDVPVFLVQSPTASLLSPAGGDSVKLAVTVRGTAAAAAFQSYSLEAAGPLPTTTVRPIGTYTRRVWRDTLAIWKLDNLPAGSYRLRLRVQSDQGISRDSVTITVADIFHPGWPIDLGANAHFSVTAVDIDGNGVQEIVCPTNRGLRVLRSDGTPYPGWPRDTLANYRTPAAFADLDGDGRYEIIIITPSQIHVYTWIGEQYPFWPRPFNGGTHAFGNSLPTVGDIDGNGSLEITAIENGGKIRVWRENGAEYVPAQAPSFGNVVATNSTSNALPQARIVDLNRDGRPELIAYGDDLRVFDGISGRPYPDQSVSPVKASHWAILALVIGDFDGDNHRDIAYVATDSPEGNYILNVITIPTEVDSDGSLLKTQAMSLPGWPRTLDPTADRFLLYAMSAGDLDGDGIPEILFAPYSLGEGRLYAFKANGDPVASDSSDGLFAHLPGSASAVAIVDIDNDQTPEIVLRIGELLFGPDQIFAFRPDGRFVPGYPIVFGIGSSTTLSTPIVGDVNADGRADMVTVQSTGTSVAVWDLTVPYSRRKRPWPQYQADYWNSGVAVTPAFNVVYMARMIDHIFFGGNPFPPFEPADLNCSGTVSIVDVAIIIDYMFFGGPRPCVP